MTGTVLNSILEVKRREVEELKRRAARRDWRRRALAREAGRDLAAALKGCPHTPIIAEVKKASPSAGRIRDEIDLTALVGDYQAGGAAALSVLTDGPFFNGSMDDLTEARRASNLPVLRKDFILDPVQLYQAKLAGADAVLLIAAALSAAQLEELFLESLELGLTPLIEVHRRRELGPVLELRPPLVGINNRDLATLKVSLETCLELRPLIPADVLVVAESGIGNRGDVIELEAAGLDAFLVGTALMRAGDPGRKLARLCGAED